MQLETYLSSILKVQGNDTQIKLNKRKHKNIIYENDGLTVKYQQASDNQEIVSVQSEQPINSSFYYFEVAIVKKDNNKCYMAIGLANDNFPTNKKLGNTSCSIGYQIDGKTYARKVEFDMKANAFKQDDVVGCGVSRSEFFFTQNGLRTQQVCKLEIEEQLYPTFCLNQDAIIRFNFGESPFVYQCQNILNKEKQELMKDIGVQEQSPYQLHLLIQEYLWCQGYLNTLKQFERDSKLQENENSRISKVDEMYYEEDQEGEMRRKQSLSMTPMSSFQRKLSGLQSPNFQQINSIERKVSGFQLDEQDNNQFNQVAEQAFLKDQMVNQERQRIQKLIREGKIGEVLQIFQEMLPEFLKKEGVVQTLYAQYFIELMKKDKLKEAIELGQNHLSQYMNFQVDCVDEKLNPIKQKIENILGLVCYDNIENSVLKGLVSQQQRERICDYINRQLLVELGYEEESALEICLKQLIQVCDQVKEKGLLGGHKVQFL